MEESKQKETAKKMVCPVCKINFCFEDTYPNGETGYLCYNCGMTSNSMLVSGSEYLEKAMISTPEFINDNKFYDDKRNIYWFLSTVRTGGGMVFPEPNDSEDGWNWTVARVVEIPTEDQKSYPIPGKDGEFYTNRLAIENATHFRKNKFYDACQELGGILSNHKVK
jgi:hypothetical protein